ncbi:MAG: hypothetical protein MRY21_00755 [Simkaniaceae bacterium]|nr:hypothetical protein [Simkaniaceae bacterium]
MDLSDVFGQIERVCALLDRAGQNDSGAYRALERSRAIAQLVVHDDASFDREYAKKIIDHFELKKIVDEAYVSHVKKVLKFFLEDSEGAKIYNKIAFPLANRYVERVVALSVGKSERLEKRDIRVATLSAMLTPLRQTIGSCFATAPAILIQSEQMGNMLSDLYELLSRGQMRRVVAGNEYKVPMSISVGSADLNRVIAKPHAIHLHPAIEGKKTASPGMRVKDLLNEEEGLVFAYFSNHALLRAWEYTLASFTDFEDTSSKRNLTVALGLEHEKPGGIGQAVYNHIQSKLDSVNEKAAELHQEYVLANDRVEMTQRLLGSASTPDRIRRLKAELQGHLHHMQMSYDDHIEEAERSKKYADFFRFIIHQYYDNFSLYFQELYDPDMHDMDENLFEDSPAGFRLIYKHGRAEPTAWTSIYDAEGYIRSLEDFFYITEPLIISASDWREASEEVQEITQLVLEHIKSEIFIKSAMDRIQELHKKMSQEEIGKKPWSYVSGGTVETLLKAYHGKESEFTVEKVIPKSPTELCIFYIDLIKEMPLPILEKAENFLAVSPNHAFILQPERFKSAWDCDQFTYTWVRDTLIEGPQAYYGEYRLNRDEQNFLMYKFLSLNPRWSGFEFSFYTDNVPLSEFAKEFPPAPTHEIAAFLKSSLPVIGPKQAKILGFTEREHFIFPEILSLLLAKTGKSESDLEAYLQLSGLLPPKPLIFGDTNWPDFLFAFSVNPVTLEFELWRVSPNGWVGHPMHTWDLFFNGDPLHEWGVFSRPSEYGGSYIQLPERLYV